MADEPRAAGELPGLDVGRQCEVKRSTASECLAPTAAVIPQPTGLINPSGPFPGAGPSSVGQLDNFGVSDVPSNYDYSFRAGIFAGDYESLAVSRNRRTR